MTKVVELRRHTDNDGDALTADGVRAALEIGTRLEADYTVLVSSGTPLNMSSMTCREFGQSPAAWGKSVQNMM